MIDLVIEPRDAVISAQMRVRRILPFRARRSVGPFIFLDEMGPIEMPTDHSADVLAHPHIGLETVTYLLSGSLFHRDSLGSAQPIEPRAVNWMTAGRGIVHSERAVDRTPLHGLQAWVALPMEQEDCAPRFEHHPAETLPHFQVGETQIHLIAGSAWGHTSPVRTASPLFYFEAHIPASQTLSFDPDGQEAAIYILQGSVTIADQKFAGPQMIVFRPGAPISVTAQTSTHCMWMGGAPLDAPRHMWWNFVSSSREKIEKAKQDWREQRFAPIPGETGFVPLPESK